MITFNPFSANFTKWSNRLKKFIGNLPTNCLSVSDHFVGLALKGLRYLYYKHLKTFIYQIVLFKFRYRCSPHDFRHFLAFSVPHTGIYPSSFTNVRFWTKIEFLNVIFSWIYHKMQAGNWRYCKLRSGFMAEPWWEFKGSSLWKICAFFNLDGK